jgi:hypothetical protein
MWLTLLGLVNLPDLQAMSVLVESRQVSPIVDRTYSLPEAADAVRTLQVARTASRSSPSDPFGITIDGLRCSRQQ